MSDFTLLGLLGPAGSGKDLVADWFVTKGFVKVAFADPMKRFVSKTFGIDWDRLWGPSEKRNEMFDISESWWYEAIGHFGMAAQEIVNNILTSDTRISGYIKLHDWLTALRKTYPKEISTRIILQTLGTEWGRTVDELMWARYAYFIADNLKAGNFSYSQPAGVTTSLVGSVPNGVVIPDHRFKNEVAATHEATGYVVRLRRLAMEENISDIGVAGHRSEAEQKNLPDSLFDLVLEFQEGVDKVHKILETTYETKLWMEHSPNTTITLSSLL